VFAFLVVRAHFISSAEGDLAHAHVKLSRASLCELLAIKMLRHFAKNQIELVAVLTVNWHPIAGAPPTVKEAVKRLVGGRDDDLEDPASAIEVFVISFLQDRYSRSLGRDCNRKQILLVYTSCADSHQ
jgi:hypothetical protein